MPAPASYTESTLRTYMYEHTQQTCDAVGLVAADFTESAYDALIAYGVDDITDATNIAKLRSLARVEAWRKCVLATAAKYDLSRDTGESQAYDKLNQLHTNAKEQLKQAEAAAVDLGYVAPARMFR